MNIQLILKLKESYDDDIMQNAITRMTLRLGAQHKDVKQLRDLRSAILDIIFD